jgi:hypothetical protein
MKAPPSRNGSMPGLASGKKLEVQTGRQVKIHKTVIYGGGSVGKSSLAAAIKQVGINPLFIDIGDGTDFLDVDRVKPSSWEEMRGVLHDRDLWANYGAVVIDDLTRAEEFSVKWTCENVKTDKGHTVTSIEGYGYGKGLTFNYETFLTLLADLDAHKRDGRHVICLAHDCIHAPENPEGENYSQYQPRLQSPASGKNSIRHRVLEWADHVLFINFDVFVSEDGKGQGSGTRTIYPNKMPGFWAKSRELSEPIPYAKGDASLWKKLIQL